MSKSLSRNKENAKTSLPIGVLWIRAIKPFDNMDCGRCLSLHNRSVGHILLCKNAEHKPVIDAVTEAGLGSTNLKRMLPVFNKLRKQFARFYPGGK